MNVIVERRLRNSHWTPADDEAVLATTVSSILRSAANAAPETIALIEGVPAPAEPRRLTYAELLGCAESAALGLTRRFERGERVASLAASKPEALVLSYAMAFAGLVLVPVNPALREGELAYVLNQSGASGVVADGEFRGTDLRQTATSAAASAPGVREVAFLHDVVDLDTRSATPSRLVAEREPSPDDIAQIVYTSGTTGLPKGARLTHGGMTNAARFGGIRFGLQPGDVYVDTMPLHHVGGQVVAFQICQHLATAVLVTFFEAGLVLELLDTQHAAVTAGVPTMLLALIEHPDFATRDVSTLRSVSSGGSVVPPELVRRIESGLGVRSTICFGQTETCGFISQTHLADSAEDKAETLGQPLPRVEARVVASAAAGLGSAAGAGSASGAGTSADGDDVADCDVLACGEIGELQVRAPFVMAGYHEMPDATTDAFAPGGWLRTGDLVTMDERGFLRIAGRVKDMIVTGGENVFPVEVETVLCEHPDVAMAAVVGVADRKWGEMVVAVVRPVPGTDPETESLVDFLKQRLAPFKIPKRIYISADLPVTASGKIQKFVLRERIEANGGVMP